MGTERVMQTARIEDYPSLLQAIDGVKSAIEFSHEAWVDSFGIEPKPNSVSIKFKFEDGQKPVCLEEKRKGFIDIIYNMDE